MVFCVIGELIINPDLNISFADEHDFTAFSVTEFCNNLKVTDTCGRAD